MDSESLPKPYEQYAIFLSQELHDKYYKIMLELLENLRGTVEATNMLMQVYQEQIEADPTALSLAPGGRLSRENFMTAWRATFAIEHSTWTSKDRAPKRGERWISKMSLGQVQDAPRASLPPALQQAQDELFGVESLRAKCGMPLDPNLQLNRNHINQFLRANGEGPFPFEHLSEPQAIPISMGGRVHFDMSAIIWLISFKTRKPQLYHTLIDMVNVYTIRATSLGGVLKTRE